MKLYSRIRYLFSNILVEISKRFVSEQNLPFVVHRGFVVVPVIWEMIENEVNYSSRVLI